jgi:hypothetical protein
LIIAVLGAMILLDVGRRQDLSRDLLDNGHFAIADAVQVDVARLHEVSAITAVHVGFAAADGRYIITELADSESVAQGMRDGQQPPPTGTEYAAPLQVVYEPAEPGQVLAVADAERWSIDQTTWRVGSGMLVAGLAIALLAAAPLLRRIHRRALLWWYHHTEDLQDEPISGNT